MVCICLGGSFCGRKFRLILFKKEDFKVFEGQREVMMDLLCKE